LALAVAQRRQEIVEALVAVVLPVVLEAAADQEAGAGERLGLVAGAERDEQAGASDGCERYRDLQLRVIAPAGTAIRVRPAMVEDVFAVGVALEVHRH